MKNDFELDVQGFGSDDRLVRRRSSARRSPEEKALTAASVDDDLASLVYSNQHRRAELTALVLFLVLIAGLVSGWVRYCWSAAASTSGAIVGAVNGADDAKPIPSDPDIKPISINADSGEQLDVDITAFVAQLRSRVPDEQVTRLERIRVTFGDELLLSEAAKLELLPAERQALAGLATQFALIENNNN